MRLKRRESINDMENARVSSADSVALSWADVLAEEKQKVYFKDLLAFVERERAAGKTIYPPNAEVFNALALTPFSSVKVVIIGQDPYHGPRQAHGLCFSVKVPTPPPPSLINIFSELESDLGLARPKHGDLSTWARQGVLLLNAVLTVEDGKPGSHANKGWERFTSKIIEELNNKREHLVFLLWGAYAQKKAEHVDRKRHLVLTAPHPSPLSAYRGFLGCKHFSQANSYLVAGGATPIDWSLPHSSRA
jgi:uracil-DNA glycosylase